MKVDLTRGPLRPQGGHILRKEITMFRYATVAQSAVAVAMMVRPVAGQT